MGNITYRPSSGIRRGSTGDGIVVGVSTTGEMVSNTDGKVENDDDVEDTFGSSILLNGYIIVVKKIKKFLKDC
jgi:hypothetical protein